MADDTPRRPLPPRGRQGESSTPRGWKVTPAPDGRGKPPARPPRGPNPRWLVALLVVGLLALNFWISSEALKPNPRVRIPYYPTFITQVSDGHVKQVIRTRGFGLS